MSAAVGAPAAGVTPTERLFSTTTNSRTAYWRVALVDFTHHPVAGSGAGTFIREWYRHRRIRTDVTDAHSLYLETLAELGLVGLAFVGLTLAVPVAAAARVRRLPLVAGAFGAYAAFVAHLGVDWDWELPGVSLLGIFCGALLVVAARRDQAILVLDRRWRTPLFAPALALLALSFVGLVGNRAEASARAAAGRGDWNTAAAQARHANGWAPWAAQPLLLQADAAIARQDTAAARALLRQAVEKDPSDYNLWTRLAAASSGRESRAARERAEALDPLG